MDEVAHNSYKAKLRNGCTQVETENSPIRAANNRAISPPPHGNVTNMESKIYTPYTHHSSSDLFQISDRDISSPISATLWKNRLSSQNPLTEKRFDDYVNDINSKLDNLEVKINKILDYISIQPKANEIPPTVFSEGIS